MSTKEALIKHGYELRESKFQGRKDIYKDGLFVATMTAWEASRYLKEKYGEDLNG